MLKQSMDAYLKQDQVSGVDARQFMENGMCRTWTLRSWEYESGELVLSVRNRVQYGDKWSDNTEYKRRLLSVDESLEMAGWFLQLYVDRSNVIDPELRAAVRCKVRDVIEFIRNTKPEPVRLGSIEWFLIPVDLLAAKTQGVHVVRY